MDYHLSTMDKTRNSMNSKKKYILKPGKHQFAPKSPAVHDNENLSDEEAEWYLEKYPHISSLFIAQQEPLESLTQSVEFQQPSVETPQESVKSQTHEDLFTTN